MIYYVWEHSEMDRKGKSFYEIYHFHYFLIVSFSLLLYEIGSL